MDQRTINRPGAGHKGGLSIDRLITLVLTLCALLMTGFTIRRAIAERQDRVSVGSPKPVAIDDAAIFTKVGHSRGPIEAPATLVVFSDFECPYCRAFALQYLPHLDSLFADSLRIIFRHLPLPNHRLAYTAARAAECAGDQGSFLPFHDELFRSQDSLGIRSFQSIAKAAGVQDLEEFDSCFGSSLPVEAIDQDVAASKKLQAQGTPTIVVGDVVVQGVPGLTVMDSLVRVAVASSRQRRK